ncbi:MAG: Wzz/FepE/Etk N-terminal domain-containing protein [Pseudomonadota bacterium]
MNETDRHQQKQGYDVGDFIRILWSRKWLIASIAFVVTSVAIAAAFLVQPTYRGEVLMAPVTTDGSAAGLGQIAGQLGGLASLAGIDIQGGDRSEEYLAILRSRFFTEAFIHDEVLMDDLFADEWCAERSDWCPDVVDVPTIRDAFERFDKDVRTVVKSTKTGFVRVVIDWHDPETASRWANTMSARLNQVLQARAIEESAHNIEFLNQRLLDTSEVELRDGIYQLIETEMRQLMLASSRSEFGFRIIDPAVASDLDDPYAPKKPIYAFFGLCIGGLLGILFALFVSRREWLG